VGAGLRGGQGEIAHKIHFLALPLEIGNGSV
jgi:hypothetical protein